VANTTDEQSTTQVEAVEVEVEEIDPFADVPEDSGSEYVKLDVRRAAALEAAKGYLGEQFESASFNDAVTALKENDHPFFKAMAASPRQRRKFGRDLRAAQPQAPKASARISKAQDLTEDLADSRDALSKVRKATDADEVRELLEQVKQLADQMIDKL
jgi:hypothetical protein